MEQLDQGVRFIEQQTQEGIVYVHCKIGYSRSAAVVGAYLLHTGLARNADEAIAQLLAARPAIVIRPEAEAAIRRYDAKKCARIGIYKKRNPPLRREASSPCSVMFVSQQIRASNYFSSL